MGEGKDGASQGDKGSHNDGADQNVQVRQPQQLAIGLQRELLLHQPRHLVDGVQGLEEEGEKRAQVDDPQPKERWGEEKSEQHPRMPPEDRGQPSARPLAGRMADWVIAAPLPDQNS